ncbi:MAG: glycosyltransferase family 2 protein [Candidatus Nanopelagicales bacterium]
MGRGQGDERPAALSARRRQWGTELNRAPLPAIEPPASDLRMWMGGAAIAATIIAWGAYVYVTIGTQFLDNGRNEARFIFAAFVYLSVVTMLTFSALMYLMARQGAQYRSRQHTRVPRVEIDAHFADSQDSITVLVPSYREETELVRGTLISAALQEFPDLRVMLLIDDPPTPGNDLEAALLEGARALPGEVMEWLAEPQRRSADALASFERETAEDPGGAATSEQIASLAAEFSWAADWLAAESIAYPRTTTPECFLADEVLGGLARDFAETAKALAVAAEQDALVPIERLAQLYRRLAWTFKAELGSFERKQYASLSGEPNKAMNLNSYIGLMGHSYRAVQTPAGSLLEVDDECGELHMPDTDYVLTLDADSALLREYCLRLVYYLEQSGNERVAIAQTPYSAFRGARTRLERMAGATTDIQHIVHQGLTYYNATFWVGANAVIRKAALDDIVEVEHVGGRDIFRYIQDRTVIEDTESSIDLIAGGWNLYNYPERLSYSASPPDFGALVVQRGRWANGGLIVIPKFMRYRRASKRAGHPVHWSETALRLNYMGSIAWASFSLVLLLLFPFDGELLSPLVFFAALPYFMAMASDFKRLGYKRTDMLRSYGFNLILLPVNLAGVIKSLQQAASKSKTAFARTPKIKNRTAAPASYIVAIYLILGLSAYTLLQDFVTRNWTNGLFAFVNTTLTAYALLMFVGVGNSLVDIAVGMWNWLHVPAKPTAAGTAGQASVDWQSVLYFGPGESTASQAAERHLGSSLATRPTDPGAASEGAPAPIDDGAESQPRADERALGA